MKKNYFISLGVGLALCVQFLTPSVFASGSCDPNCGLTNQGSISGPTSICVGQPATYLFSGATCKYSGCSFLRYIKVYCGTSLVYTSSPGSSVTHVFTPSSSGTYTIYGYVKASTYSVYCETNSICLTVKAAPACPPSVCSPIFACVNTTFTLSGTPSSGSSIKWYKGTTYIGSGNSLNYSETSTGTYQYLAYSYNSTTGCMSETATTVTAYISAKPTNLSITGTSTGFVGTTYTFNGSASGTGLSYSWNFGSGATPQTFNYGPVSLHNAWVNSNGAFAYTNSSGSNRMLVLTVGMEHSAMVDLTGVTYGGKALTQAVEKPISTNAPSYGRVEVWYLKESDLASAGTGSKSFVFTWSGTPDYTMYAAAVFKNVNQSSPIGNIQSVEGSGNPMSVASSLSYAAGDVILLTATCGNSGSYTPTLSNYVEANDFTNSSTCTFANYYKILSASGSESPGVTFNSSVNRQGLAALVLKGYAQAPMDVVYSTTGKKTIKMIVSNGDCSDSTTKTVDVCGKAVISCPGSTCINTSIQLSATDMGTGSIYSWSFGSGATPSTATGKGPHSVVYGSSGSKTVTLTLTNSTMSSCSHVSTATVNVTAGPSAVITGPVTGNINTNYTFTTPSISGATYSWTVPTDGVIVSGSGTHSMVIKWPSNGTKNFSVTVTKDGCTATDNHTIEISTCPNAVITACPNLCQNIATTFSAVDQGSGVTYAWNYGSGASPATGTGVGPNTVSYTTSGTKIVTLTVSKAGCSNKSVSVSFTVYPSPGSISITPPPFTIFTDTALTYTATAVAGATYSWSATGGAVITGSGNSVQIKFTNAGSQTISVTVTLNGCTSQASVSVNVKTPVCSGIKFNITGVPLKTSMKNYTFTHASGNWLKLRKESNANDSFHTSRKFQRSNDTSISWQEICSQEGKATLKFNRSASDLKFSIRDIDKSATGEEIVSVSAFLQGNLISTSQIAATFNSTNIQLSSNTGTSLSYKGITTGTNSSNSNDLALHFLSKVDSVHLKLSNTNTASGSGSGSGSNSSTSPDGKYRVDLIDAGVANSSNYVWTWKMSNLNPANTSQAISHWNITFNDCAIKAGIMSKVVKVQWSYNGSSWTNLNCPSYQGDKSMTCEHDDIVFKFDAGMNNGGYVIYYRLILSVDYEVDYSSVSYWKAGKACGEMTFAGIGCPKTATCISDIALSKMSWCITEPLPVTWLNVSAFKNTDKTVSVNWITATELNNDYFNIERSSDGRDFKSIGQVKGEGTKNTVSKYRFLDESPLSKVAYYRIKQMDYDGEFAYSSVVVLNPEIALQKVRLQPNPASVQLNINWDSGIKDEVTIQLTDLTGVVLLSETISGSDNSHVINTSAMNNGLYLVNIVHANSVIYRSKIMIAR